MILYGLIIIAFMLIKFDLINKAILLLIFLLLLVFR